MIQQFSPQMNEITLDRIVNFINTCEYNLLGSSIDFCDKFVNRLAADKNPHYVGLKSFFSKNKTTYLLSKYESRYPIGLCFHVTPNNIDLTFMYSFLLSILCGNTNIVRVSSKNIAQWKDMFMLLNKILDDDEFEDIRNNNMIVLYQHGPYDVVTPLISKTADVRVLWGNDESVSLLRQYPSKMRSRDVVLGNGFSYCTIDCAYYLKNKELHQHIANRFFRDAYWLRQQPCVCPRIVFFVGGTNECKNVSAVFWRELIDGPMHLYHEDDICVSNRNLYLYDFAMSTGKKIKSSEIRKGQPLVIKVDYNDIVRNTYSDGVFLESYVSDISFLGEFAKCGDHTISYCADSGTMIENAVDGRYRVTPIGSSLYFNEMWGGYNLIRELTDERTT